MTFVRADGVAGNRSDNFPRCGNGDKNRHNIKALLEVFWRQHCVFICAARVAAFVALEGRTQAAKKTKIQRRGPPPAEWDDMITPAGAREIVYVSGTLQLKAWINTP